MGVTVQVFEDMRRAGVVSDVGTYSALLCAFVDGHQWDKAAEVYREMKTLGMQPDARTYAALNLLDRQYTDSISQDAIPPGGCYLGPEP